MKGEIKIILDYLKNDTFIPDETKRKYKILHRDEVKKLLDYITNLQTQLQQKENIIKEVREYINNNTYKTEWGDFEEDNEDININDDLSEKNFIESILEILDKEGK